MKKLKLLISIGLFSISLVSCHANNAKNCILYGKTHENDNGELVAEFTKNQKKTKDSIEIYSSNSSSSSGNLVTLENRGIVFNKTNVGYVNQLIININDKLFESARVFYGSSPFPVKESQPLVFGENIIHLSEENRGFFVIQNQGPKFSINSIIATYSKEEIAPRETELHSVYINTENNQNVTSLVDYVKCNIITDEYEDGLEAQIRVRGNSTAIFPKKPYRIKLDKKASLFGYKKSKNYVLLADYLDGSRMHNYSALMFSKLLRDSSEFAPTPIHVNVYLNNEYRGVYLFCEHIDEKSEHLNIGQDKIWNLDFNDINFYLDRDIAAMFEANASEGETYIEIKMANYDLESYCFELKYPEKEDFIEEKDDNSEVFHENEWNSYISNLRQYLTNVCQAFVNYKSSASAFSEVNEIVDVNSLAKYGVVDQLLCEADHINKSFKVFRTNGGKLQFGPCWDYDSCSFGFPYQEEVMENPFKHDGSGVDYIHDIWMRTLYSDETNGKPLFKAVWDELTEDSINTYLNDLYSEIEFISYDLLMDCDKWIESKYYIMFDNLYFVTYYMVKKTAYLKGLYN